MLPNHNTVFHFNSDVTLESSLYRQSTALALNTKLKTAKRNMQKYDPKYKLQNAQKHA